MSLKILSVLGGVPSATLIILAAILYMHLGFSSRPNPISLFGRASSGVYFAVQLGLFVK